MVGPGEEPLDKELKRRWAQVIGPDILDRRLRLLPETYRAVGLEQITRKQPLLA